MAGLANAVTCVVLFGLLCSSNVNGLNFNPVTPPSSIPDLVASAYRPIDGWPCVRLHTLTGPVGCANPGRLLVSAPLQRVTLQETIYTLMAERTLLLPSELLGPTLHLVSTLPHVKANVKGILVEYNETAPARGTSPMAVFPQSEFADPSVRSYPWNPNGADVSTRFHDLPVLLLSNSSTLEAREAAHENELRGFRYPMVKAEADVIMQTTKAAARTTEECLSSFTCLPLGGYSVVSSLPPPLSNVTSPPPSSSPLIILSATMDATSFFRDAAVGAESSISGLIALLLAADVVTSALSKLGYQALHSRIVFVAFTGEQWGYLGSRRLLFELQQSSPHMHGVTYEDIKQAVWLELGSLGQGLHDSITSVYMHRSDNEAPANDLTTALQTAATSMSQTASFSPFDWITSDDATKAAAVAASANQHQVEVHMSSGLGFPPSSLLAVHREVSINQAVYLSDFNASFSNRFYGSHYDGAGNIDPSSISSIATLAARALLLLSGFPPSHLHEVTGNFSLATNLTACLLTPFPGLSCPLALSLITPRESAPNHYVGVFIGAPSHRPYPGAVADVSRFVWNFLAARTAAPVPEGQQEPACAVECEGEGQVCVGSRATVKGTCMTSNTWYVPAYSPRLKHTADTWQVLPPRDNNEGDLADPIWTESFWDHLSARMYLADSEAVNWSILAAGCVWTAVLCVWAVWMRGVIEKRFKQA